MNSKYESLDEFFKQNETRVNTFLAKSSFSIIPIYPAIIVFTLKGAFPQTSILRLVFLSIFSFALAFTFYIANKKNPDSTINKSVLLFFTNLMIFLLSTEQSLQLSFSYILTPLYSTLYFDEKLTLKTFIACYITMILSYIVRAFIIPYEYMFASSRLEWGLVHGVASTIEYLFFAIACYLLSKEVKNLIINVFNHRQNVSQIQEEIIIGFGNIIEAKEGINARNIKLTTEYLKIICYKLREKGLFSEFLTDTNIKLMITAVPFHDIGKVSIPKEILNKTGKLTAEEYAIIKCHPIDGADFVTKKLSVLNDVKLINIARDMALYHHERVDGNGYPYKLKGDSIPISARIMTAADTLDALLSRRSYKEAYSVEKAIQIIKELGGKAIDKNIAEAIVSCREEIEYVRKGAALNDE